LTEEQKRNHARKLNVLRLCVRHCTIVSPCEGQFLAAKLLGTGPLFWVKIANETLHLLRLIYGPFGSRI
jgi:hypothetical protein